jgi:hypothetical protein
MGHLLPWFCQKRKKAGRATIGKYFSGAGPAWRDFAGTHQGVFGGGYAMLNPKKLGGKEKITG